jgi:excisionase family DNA binding protein
MVVLVADGDPGKQKPRRKTPAAQRRPGLPSDAIERAKEIAASAPPVSDALRARLQMVAWGMPAGAPENEGDKQPLPADPVAEFIAKTVAAAPPVSDRLCADIQMILWGAASPAPLEGTAQQHAGRETASPVPARAQRDHADAGWSDSGGRPKAEMLPASDSSYIDVGLEALDLLTVDDVAKRLRVSKTTVKRLIYAERKEPGTGLESVKVGDLVRIAPEDLAAYIARLRGSQG